MDLKVFLEQHADPKLITVLESALKAAAADNKRTYLAHVVDVLLDHESMKSRLDPDVIKSTRAQLADWIRDIQDNGTASGEFAFNLSALVEPAIQTTREMGGHKVTPLGMMATCLAPDVLTDPESTQVLEILRRTGVRLEDLAGHPSPDSLRARDFTFQSLGFGTDLTAMAQAGWWEHCPVIGMEEQLENLAMLISAAKRSVVLVGEPGVGKSVLVEGLAFHMARGTRPLIPRSIDQWTLVSISATDLKAGMGVQGALESRVQKMLQFFKENPNVVPFFDEIHTLLNTEDPTSQILANALKPAMARRDFRCIGASTNKEYARFVIGDEAMKRRFVQIQIPEPSPEATCKILAGIAAKSILKGQAENLGVSLTPTAIETTVSITNDFLRSERQPAKSINLLLEVVEERIYKLQTEQESRTLVEDEDIADWFSRRSKIPVDSLDRSRSEYYTQLEVQLKKAVLGQNQAIEMVCSWLKLMSSGWLDNQKPRGRFLFLGPPGVGKTELAKQLASEVMHGDGSMIERNMADFSGQTAKTRWQGSDPGYVGFGTTSTVYSEVTMNPYSVVVLDEFEKAHESMCEPLLSVLDGSGEDSQGRKADFSQCIFILTSNALMEIEEGMDGDEEIRKKLISIGGIWNPALVDRLDGIVFFNQLDLKTLGGILDLMIGRREKSASRPMPAELQENKTRELILSWAAEGGQPSARRLDRALSRWLINWAEKNS
jgi:ATP-dependent Clp protease ATP-binding subunit ClpA